MTQTQERNLSLAVAWTCGTLTSMLLMGIAARELSVELAPHHMSLYRNIICLALLLPFVAPAAFATVRTSRLKGHVARNTIHFTAQWCWFYGLGVLPLAEVFDPTGAGDTFAGGFCGYLAKTEDVSFENMKNAIIYGSNLASFCVEKFGTQRMEELTAAEVQKRLHAFKELTQFDIELA